MFNFYDALTNKIERNYLSALMCFFFVADEWRRWSIHRRKCDWVLRDSLPKTVKTATSPPPHNDGIVSDNGELVGDIKMIYRELPPFVPARLMMYYRWNDVAAWNI